MRAARRREPASAVVQWRKGQLIGSGSFGIVYQGFNTHTGELFAVKQICIIGDDTNTAHEVGCELCLLGV
jgi:serine/threonine protein kinase